MRSSSNNYEAFIYHSERQSMGANGVQFERKRKTMQIRSSITFDELKSKIHQKLGLQGNQCIYRLMGMYETITPDGKIYYVSQEITDDDDVAFALYLFDNRNRKEQNVIELYVEFDFGEHSSLPMHISTSQSYSQEDIFVGMSPPVHVLSQITLREVEEEEDEEEIDSEEEGDLESVIPLGDSSYTDVEGNFDADTNPINLSSLAVSPLHVDPISGVWPGIAPFWNENPYCSNINWEHPNKKMEMLYGEDDLHGGWREGDPLYVQ